MAEEKTKLSFGEKIKKFFKDNKSEFKKISWPDKKDTTKKTIMVIGSIVIVGAAIFAVDTGFNALFTWLTNL
ncbi:MAG: preprotein translocase subunit SecE [Ruminococcaceae bacterium]|jgi:preprotein translocase subunit SecE|nr:preprotein translocase subunit SecE [Oscillospiraceae bacterium]MBR5553439.1 preprotein translocase subunit SecE [Clostridia bacterium]